MPYQPGRRLLKVFVAFEMANDRRIAFELRELSLQNLHPHKKTSLNFAIVLNEAVKD